MKKILLLTFLAFLIIIPAGKVGAAQYFVGVTIASATAPGLNSTTDNHWCLPTGGTSYDGSRTTQIYIRTSGGSNLTAVAPTSNPTYLTKPACAGSTVWSALFDLTSGTQYQIYIYVNSIYNPYCPGYAWDDSSTWCMVTPQTSTQNCCDACTYYGLTEHATGTNCTAASTSCSRFTVYSYTNANSSNNCVLEASLMGTACSSCTTGQSYGWFNPTTHACGTPISYTGNTTSYTASADGATSCAASGAGNPTRVCVCSSLYSYNTRPAFTFNFTPTF